ncbi:MAG: DUF4142 domain-containing protein, partial [Terriglobales bacterium]
MRTNWTTIVVCSWLLVSGLLLGGILFAQPKPADKSQKDVLSAVDRTFIINTAEANLAEIDTAKMVGKKSTDPGVQQFTGRMIKDHTQANHELATLANNYGITLPSAPSAADRKQQDELQKLSDPTLNEAYLRDELQGHKQVIAEFEQEIEHGQDKAVKDFAEQTLPTLQDHI